MNHQPYSSVKAAGIEWVESIPSHWDVLPLQRVGHERTESNVGMIDSNLLSLSYGRIVQKDIDSNDGLLPESFETYQVVHPGDIVLRLTDLQNDKRSLRSAIVDQRGIITSAYCALCSEQIDSKFASYLFRSYDLTKVFYSMGGGLRQSLKYSDLKRLPIIVPSVSEQKQIATFLDHETERIDALVEEQQSLIELLREKRQAVISHAVTKGLDPSVQMKDSGVEWIGQVPQHWSVSKLRYLTSRISSGKTPSGGSETYVDEGVIFIRSQNVYDDGLRLDDVAFISEEVDESMASSRIVPGDILLNITGGSIGRTCVVPQDLASANVNQHVCAIRLIDQSQIAYVSFFMKSDFIKKQIDFIQNGAAREGLNFEQIGQFLCLLPPHDEQEKISSFVVAETKKFESLLDEAQAAIDLLQERRSALISAAVTGMIDVRNWKKQEEEVPA